jgi:hypothetical protein
MHSCRCTDVVTQHHNPSHTTEGEAYTYGEETRCGDGGKADMWLNEGPAVEQVATDP